MKAQRLVLLSKLHGVTLTRADLDADDGLTLPAALFDAAGLTPHEKADVYCLESGCRLSCEVRRGRDAEAWAGGAAALLLKPGARVVVAVFGWLKGKQAAKHKPLVLHVDADNALR